MTFKMQDKKIEGICITDDNATCKECELKELILCNFSKKFANKFLLGNVIYRITAIILGILTGFLTNQWWMVIIYTISVFLVFFFIEPRLLCSHCSFYAKEGKFLQCWALRGMPKLWKYRPEPCTSIERKLMFGVGAFIDLFPFVIVAVGIIGGLFVALNHLFNFLIFSFLIGLTIIFFIIVKKFDNLLRGGTCKKCVNFSCSLNKTPENLRKKFLQKNPTMSKAWISEDIN